MTRPPYYVPDDRPRGSQWRVFSRVDKNAPVPPPNRFNTRDQARARAKELNEQAASLTR